ncbi:MAG TPA: endoribonuclease MazF [Verrucomicrobiae bacterium]|nr:endoribonuclease MazF [Verrucomicrobiae bacterium]
MAGYVPDRGDIVWIDCDPQTGHEQSGRRPAVVLSPRSYNRPAGLALLCPITNRSKGYPFEVPLVEGLPVTGVVLADQVRSLDWRARQVSFIGALDEQSLIEVVERLRPLIGFDDE